MIASKINNANTSNRRNGRYMICSDVTFDLPVSETTTFSMEPFSVACLIFLLSAAQYTKPCTSSTSIPRICTSKTYRSVLYVIYNAKLS